MYAWLWRRLPGGPGTRLLCCAVLLAAVAALLWFVIFPWAESLLPFDDSVVGPTRES
ncbi:hypothetical protein [Nonomuraea sp. PA05]|uniref:hypothetical protein n=1 Tax=Nonomuraea sp. PA05 TaxID=2604466 RepID=UPI0016527065|nr:hypothetical protein [Nonomuraea sp. PA05]